MCGVIVLDAGMSWSTNLGRDAYMHDHCLGYRHDYLLFYQLPNSNLFTHRMLFSREKPLVKSTSLGLFPIILVFRSIYPKNQKYLAALFIYLIYFVFFQIYLSKLIQFYLCQYRGGIENPSYALGCKYFFLYVHVPLT